VARQRFDDVGNLSSIADLLGRKKRVLGEKNAWNSATGIPGLRGRSQETCTSLRERAGHFGGSGSERGKGGRRL